MLDFCKFNLAIGLVQEVLKMDNSMYTFWNSQPETPHFVQQKYSPFFHFLFS